MTTSEQLHGQGPGDIRELLARIKNGDEEAARELLNRYESKVRLVVRRQLPRLLRSRFDSTDFLQSVWGSFFHRIQTEPNDLNEEENLIAFLAWAARNKVIDEDRRVILELKAAGYSCGEIGDRVGLSERTVQRVLEELRNRARIEG